MDWKIETVGSKQLQDALEKFTYEDVKRVNRLAINRTVIYVRALSVRKISKVIRMPVKKIKDDYTRTTTAKASTPISQAAGTVEFKGKAIPAINFVVGSARPSNQRGIGVKKRRLVRIQVMRGGPKTALSRGFIMNTGRGGNQLFVRHSKGYRISRTRSVANLIEKNSKSMTTNLIELGGFRYARNFAQILNNLSSLKGPKGFK